MVLTIDKPQGVRQLLRAAIAAMMSVNPNIVIDMAS
jgi:hypothetical protein